MSDLRYALRQLWKEPRFTIVAILALALGIGANTAIFRVINAVLLHPLPFAKPEQLLRIYNPGPQLEEFPISPANFIAWQPQNRVFQGIAAYTGNDFTILGLLAAIAVARLMQTLLFRGTACDPFVFGLVTVSLGLIAFLAALLPALRATKPDPVSALRSE